MSLSKHYKNIIFNLDQCIGHLGIIESEVTKLTNASHLKASVRWGIIKRIRSYIKQIDKIAYKMEKDKVAGIIYRNF